MSIKSFANGLVVGLILGILFAPDSGNETRRKIAKKASDIKDAACDKYNDIASTVAGQYGRIKSKAQDMMGKGDKLYSDVKDDTTNMFE
jgi:gas vesicle protein